MGDQVFAVLGLVFCAFVWGGMALGPVRTQRLRQRVQGWLRQRRGTPRPQHGTEADLRQARDAAAAAIERARRKAQVEREGNVYRPDRFQPRQRDGDGPDKLH